nr:aldo/keto reductase [Kutzneria chonburiensis]
MEELWQACETLVTQGKVLYFGSSNFAGWHLAVAQAEAAKRNFLGLVSEQSHYNLLTREVELEVLPSAQAHGIGVIPWSPLASGLLGGSVRGQREGKRRFSDFLAKTLERKREQLGQWEDFAEKLGHQPGDLALAWLLHQPAVTAPIIGPRTPEQLAGGLKSVDITLSEDDLATIDEIFPGYKTAPEHYSW